MSQIGLKFIWYNIGFSTMHSNCRVYTSLDWINKLRGDRLKGRQMTVLTHLWLPTCVITSLWFLRAHWTRCLHRASHCPGLARVSWLERLSVKILWTFLLVRAAASDKSVHQGSSERRYWCIHWHSKACGMSVFFLLLGKVRQRRIVWRGKQRHLYEAEWTKACGTERWRQPQNGGAKAKTSTGLSGGFGRSQKLSLLLLSSFWGFSYIPPHFLSFEMRLSSHTVQNVRALLLPLLLLETCRF